VGKLEALPAKFLLRSPTMEDKPALSSIETMITIKLKANIA